MAKKRHTPEQVINKRREAEVARRIGATEQTFYRWRSEYGFPWFESTQAHQRVPRTRNSPLQGNLGIRKVK